MNQIYIPLIDPVDWQNLLGNPKLHWKDDYSAKLTAESWMGAVGFPAPIAATFQSAGAPFDTLKPQLVLPEHKVALPPHNTHPTQCDVWVLASHANGLASIAVEGKKEESFGPTVDEWLQNASVGKVERLDFLKQLLGLSVVPGTLRYQFLHRSAGSILEAQRFHANMAVLVIQSFSPNDAGLPEYQVFTDLFGLKAQPGNVVLLSQASGVPFYATWIRS